MHGLRETKKTWKISKISETLSNATLFKSFVDKRLFTMQLFTTKQLTLCHSVAQFFCAEV